MDEPKLGPPKIERKKVELTDEQKAEIRLEMLKCNTPEEAREHRKFLAEYFGVTVQQVAAVSAYKVKEDGTLDLKPQFGKSPAQVEVGATEPSSQGQRSRSTELSLPNVITPQIESVYDNPTKREWRIKVKEAIAAEFTPEQLRDARVVCLPGRALQEVVEVYLPLGVRPENIVCIERDPEAANALRKSATLRNLPVKIFEGSIDDYLQRPHEPITIASFDFLGPLHESFLMSIQNIKIAKKFIIVTNCLQRREQKNTQHALRSSTTSLRSVNKVLDLLPNYVHMLPRAGSTFMDVYNLMSMVARTSKQTIELGEARDEGIAPTLIGFMLAGQSRQAVDKLFADGGSVAPQFKSDIELQAFEQHMLGTIVEGIEKLIGSYPVINSRLSMKSDSDSRGNVVPWEDKGKHGFLLNFYTVMRDCLGDLTLCNLQRYEYASEISGSPYQTDIITLFDWKRELEEKRKNAYEFIRDCLRVIGLNPKNSISFQFESAGKVLPKNYAGSNAKVDLTIMVNSDRFRTIRLLELIDLVTYFRQKEKKVTNGKTPQDFLDQAKVKIEPQ